MTTSRSSASNGSNLNQFKEELNQSLEGEAKFDLVTRQIYSIDASIYQVIPVAVVIPKNVKDILTTVRLANKFNIPITARGAATGITGGCIGTGVVIDTSKYLNKILEINIDEEYALCEPGVIQDQLNEALAPYGYRLGPDTSTGDRATLGGMVANNSAGARSLRYGKMVDHVEEIELVLSSGELMNFGYHSREALLKMKTQNDTESRICTSIVELREKYREEITKRFPKIPRRVSGYNLDELIKHEGLNLSKLICGSEGTLGVITKVKVKIAKVPAQTGLCLIFVDDMITGMQHLPLILQNSPIAVEMIDRRIIESGVKAPSMRGKLEWLERIPEAIFVVELEEKSFDILKETLEAFASKMKLHGVGTQQKVVTDKNQMFNIWALRKAGLGLLLSKRTYSRAIAFLEDLTVAPEQLAPFMERFREYLQAKGKEAGIYGHVGSGCMHIRPYIDLRDPQEVALMKTMMEEVTDLIIEHGGALSGEHGDGYIRSWLNEKLFGKKLYTAFLDVKEIFDPNGLMNPHKIVNGLDVDENLKTSPSTRQRKIDTFLDFTREGGFELAVDMCNGNAACRKTQQLMCPSFQATRDEYQTTRARAQTLRGIINGNINIEEFTGKNLYDVLDLCIECKGCKTECPSQVDMAKMKSEFLYHYHKKHGHPLRNKLFAHIAIINKAAFPFRKLFNAFSRTAAAKKLLHWIGITPHRPLPELASERFTSSLKTKNVEGKAITLFIDTYTEYHTPEIGHAAIQVLEALGYCVTIVAQQCCGRPMISKGMLDKAQHHALKVLHTLHPHAKEGQSIVILEPSCLSAIQDDYYGLVNSIDEASRKMYEIVSAQSHSFEEFLAQHIQDGKLPLDIDTPSASHIVFHGHCHQKSLTGTGPMKKVLESIPHTTVTEIPSGCCGVAGSFGYEDEHYDVSMAIGNLKLIPFLKSQKGKINVVANGFSCRSQIQHGTGKEALHIAEFIAKHLSSSKE